MESFDLTCKKEGCDAQVLVTYRDDEARCTEGHAHEVRWFGAGQAEHREIPHLTVHDSTPSVPPLTRHTDDSTVIRVDPDE